MTQTLQSIAWTLIHFCWQAAAIAVAYRLASLAIARRSSQVRYLVALSTLLVMLIASVATFAWEFRAVTVSSSVTPTALDTQSSMAGADLPHILKPGFVASHREGPGFSPTMLLPWIDGLWIVGVVALSLRSLGGWWLIQRLRASATAQAPANVMASFTRICAALELRRPVMLRVSEQLAGPVTVGALRAMVLLPLSAMMSLGPDELEVVLAHELAHVRRADFIWNLVQTLVETLFFFHPAVWWIGSRIRHERELCCDDLALKVCPNPVVYASALFRLEEQRSRQWRMAMALDGHQSPQTLRFRIARILGEPAIPGAVRRVQPFSLAAACAALIVLLLPAPQVLASLHQGHPAAVVPAATVGSLKVVGGSGHHSTPDVVHPLVVAPIALPTAQDSSPAPLSTEAESGSTAQSANKPDDSVQSKSSYIDRMKAAGYDVDLDKYIAMKVQNVTPEYAREMAQAGFGKPSADDLIACKIHGVTPEAIAQFKKEGFEVNSLQDAISFRIFQVTPEFVEGMKAAGFTELNSKLLLSMRVQGVTPEYARTMKQQFPNVKAEDLVKARIFHIDSAFIASAKSHGFANLSFDKLVQLRISGLLDDESK